MKDLVYNITKKLVDHPNEVKVEEEIVDGQATIEVSVAESDIGQVIGKHGKIANSIRTIAKAAGTKQNLKVFVVIAD